MILIIGTHRYVILAQAQQAHIQSLSLTLLPEYYWSNYLQVPQISHMTAFENLSEPSEL